MNFVSISFALLYLLVLTSRFYFVSKDQKGIYLNTLLISSLIFYGWYVPNHLILLLSIVFIHYYAAIGIDRFRLNQVMTKIILIAAVAVSLLVLAYFKYSGFLLDLINSLANKKQSLSTYQFILPVAISFYCFQSISYSVDVFRNRVAVEKRFLRLLLYIGFFPQLVAGPIVRASQLLYQFNRSRKPRLSIFYLEPI
ncbi:MAG: alginate O-acetyltransferase complex protein AlgI [Arenicella sp.]|jgi:alginate O-acetyltransferase complex protein AlgI